MEIFQMKPREISGWTYLLTFGFDLDIYQYGNLRIGIDRETGKQLIGYRSE